MAPWAGILSIEFHYFWLIAFFLKRYEFNDSDLETSKTVLLNLLNANDEIPWDAITFVTGRSNFFFLFI